MFVIDDEIKFRTRTTHILTATRLISDAGVSARDKNMLGEQIAELKRKMISQRVLDSEGPTMETSVSAKGSIKGIQVNETLSYVARLTSSGVLHGEGHAVIMAGESDLAEDLIHCYSIKLWPIIETLKWGIKRDTRGKSEVIDQSVQLGQQ